MARQRNTPPPDATPKWCPKCETEIAADDWYWHADGTRSNCRVCARRWHQERYKPRGRALETRVIECEWCKEPFETRRADTRFCSRKCKGVARNAAAHEARVGERAAMGRLCAGCGKPIPPTRRIDAAYCSDECADTTRGTTSKASRRLKARGENGEVIHVRRVDIYERDGWICQLCGKPVDRTARFPAPWAASLDHIIPLARGGTHEPSNLQTAHVRCNVTRRDKPLTNPAPALTMNGKAYLRVPEAAERLGITVAVLDRWIRQGHIQVHRFENGRYRYLRADELETILAADFDKWDRRTGTGRAAAVSTHERKFLTIPRAAERLGIPPGRIYAWINNKDPIVTPVRLGNGRGAYFLDEEEVEALAAGDPAWLDGRHRRWLGSAHSGPAEAKK